MPAAHADEETRQWLSLLLNALCTAAWVRHSSDSKPAATEKESNVLPCDKGKWHSALT